MEPFVRSIFNIETFIGEVKQRPAIWNTTLKEYGDKNVKKVLWKEIVLKFGGGQLEPKEKEQFGIQLQKQWRRLRYYYFRELRRPNNVRNGVAAPKKITSVLFEQLQFLESVAQPSSTILNVEHANEREATDFTKTRPLQKSWCPAFKRKVTKDDLKPVKALKAVKSREHRETDESDKLFLLSLLDDFRRIPASSKSLAKIEMIKLLHHLQIEGSPHAPHLGAKESCPSAQMDMHN